MKISYLFHSGFLLQGEECAVVFDFYEDSVTSHQGVLYDFLCTGKKTVYVLASHHHADHYNPVILSWKKLFPEVSFQFIFSNDIRSRLRVPREEAHFLHLGEEFRDERIFIKAYGSTDVGISFYVHLEGKEIFHAGDLNNWHWREESSADEVAKSESAYRKELDFMARDRKKFDLVMFPVDPRQGKEYAKGAIQFVERFPTRFLCPMHFMEKYGVSRELERQIPSGCSVIHLDHKGQDFTF